jgi:HAMP domain-containing protein
MEVLKRSPDVTASSIDLPNGTSVFNFDTPILFQNKEVGRIYMGISKVGLERVMAITRLLMMGVVVLTVLAVVVMLYVFGGLLAKPMKRLRQAMLAVGAGDFDQRISEVRRDEIGELFNTFNRMAEGLGGLVAKHAADGAEAPDLSARPNPAMGRDDDDAPPQDGDLARISAGPAIRPVIDASLIAPADAPAPAASPDNPFIENDPFNENEPAHENDPFAEEPDAPKPAARAPRKR